MTTTDQLAARAAFIWYNAGPNPSDGDLKMLAERWDEVISEQAKVRFYAAADAAVSEQRASIDRSARIDALKMVHESLAAVYKSCLNTGIAPGIGYALRELSDTMDSLNGVGLDD